MANAYTDGNVVANATDSQTLVNAQMLDYFKLMGITPLSKTDNNFDYATTTESGGQTLGSVSSANRFTGATTSTGNMLEMFVNNMFGSLSDYYESMATGRDMVTEAGGKVLDASGLKMPVITIGGLGMLVLVAGVFFIIKK